MAIGVALIGYGMAGRYLHAPFLHPARFDLRTVVTSRRDEVLADFPKAEVVTDPADALARDDVDLVVIAAPNHVHASLAHRALAAGKHVVVDKPMTVTVDEADALIDTAERAKRLLTVYQNRRWDGDFLTVEKLVASGDLGRLALYEARWDRFRPVVAPRWREEEHRGGGILIDLGPHLVDQTLRLFGWPDWLQTDVLRQREGTSVDDGFSLRLGYGSMRAAIEVSLLSAIPRPRFHLHGDAGSFRKNGIDAQEAELRAGRHPLDPGFGDEPAGERGWLVLADNPAGITVQGRAGRWLTFWEGVVAAIRQGGSPPVDPAEARDALYILETARESAETGQRLTPAAPRAVRYISGASDV